RRVKDTDFNDMLIASDVDAVKQAIDAAAVSEEKANTTHTNAAPKQTDQLLQLVATASLFHTTDGKAYADVLVDEHRRTLAIRSSTFHDWLRRTYYEKTGKAPN